MTSPDETYWAYCSQGELRLQQCDACAAWQFPPVNCCMVCQHRDLAWKPVSGMGSLWSWVRFHKPYFKNGDFDVPYLVAMVELDEGVRMISALLAADGTRQTATSARCGDRVALVFPPPPGQGRRLPHFQLITGPE